MTVAPAPPDPAELKLIADPETRHRVAMAAESDLEAFRYAHWRGTVTFHDVAASWFHMSDPNLPPGLRDEFKTLFPGLLDAFAEPRKGIITSYFCRHIRVAAALTDIGHAAGAPEGVPEAAIKGPPPAGIAALLDGEPPDAGTNGHGEIGVAHESRAGDERAGGSARAGDERAEGSARVGDDPPGSITRWRERRTREYEGGLWRRLRPGRPHLFDSRPAASSAIHIEPTFGDPEDWKAKAILFECLHLHYKALEFLTPQPRKICLRMIFGVITTLLGTLDHRQLERDAGRLETQPFGTDPAEIETLERELKQAQMYYEASAQRQAQLEYLVGMLMFLVLAIAGTTAIALFTPLLDEAATVSVLGGAAGAVVSVMNRMTGGHLRVRTEAGKKTIRALGFMRPVLGATFGAVVYLFLDGGIVQVLAPPSGGENLAFYAALGFLSGFSERFAQDVIAQASREPEPPPATNPPPQPAGL
jgi:hypothetical protein